MVKRDAAQARPAASPSGAPPPRRSRVIVCRRRRAVPSRCPCQPTIASTPSRLRRPWRPSGARRPPASPAASSRRVCHSSLRRTMSGSAPSSCDRHAQRLRRRVEALEDQALADLRGGARTNPQQQAGDDAEHALGSDKQLAQRGAGRAGGQRRGRELAGRRRQPQALDRLVDAAVAARGLADRAGRRATADRYELEAVRIVAERQVVLGERGFKRHRPRSGRDGDRQRAAVDCEQAGEPREIERDHRLLGAGERLQAAHGARAAAVGHDRDALGRAGRQNRQHRLMAVRIDDGVGHRAGPARAQRARGRGSPCRRCAAGA